MCLVSIVTSARLFAYPCYPLGWSPAPCDFWLLCGLPHWPSKRHYCSTWHWRYARIQSYFQGARKRRPPQCRSGTLQPFGPLLHFDELQYDCYSLLGHERERWSSGWCCRRGSQWFPFDSGLHGDKRGSLTFCLPFKSEMRWTGLTYLKFVKTFWVVM